MNITLYSKTTTGLIIGVCLIISFYGNGQNIDSDIQNLYHKAKELIYSKPDSAIVYAKQLKRLTNNGYLKLDADRCIISAYYEDRKFEKAIQVSMMSLKRIDSLKKVGYNVPPLSFMGFKDCKAYFVNAQYVIHYKLFFIYKNTDRYQNAQRILEKLELLSKDIPEDDSNKIAHLYSSGLLDQALGNFRQSNSTLMNYYKQFTGYDHCSTKGLSLELCRNSIIHTSNINAAIAENYVNLFQMSQKLSFLDSAQYYNKTAFDIARQMPDPNEDTFSIYILRKINTLLLKQDYRAALILLHRYDDQIERFKRLKVKLYSYKCTAHLGQKAYDSAIFYGKKYLATYDRQSRCYNNILLSTYGNLSDAYLGLNQTDSALVYSNLALKKLQELETSKSETNLRIHQKQINAIKDQNKRLLKESNSFKITLLCLTGGLISIIPVFFFQRKKIKKSDTPLKIDSQITDAIVIKLKEFEKTTLFLNKDLSINSLAKQLNTNTTYLSFIINSRKGKSFKNYISELRLNYIIKKLRSDPKYSKYSIEALGLEIGYNNASAFSRAFKKYTGQPPSQFIKTCKQSSTSGSL